jgi:osmotically inducible lipoprotein OsmB
MKFRAFVLVLLLIPFVIGCSGLSKREQRVLSGAAIGAGTGIVGAAVTGGSLVTGAVVGTAAGAVGGLIVDEVKKRTK